jgi:site-specific DNA recombinase
MNKKVILYARVSSDDRSNDGRNLDGQLDMCRHYALEHDHQIVAELAEDDRGASGASFELEKLNEALEMARSGYYDVLIVRELDRLSRNLAKQLIVEEELKRLGVTIEYVLGEYPDTPEGNLMKNIRATVAEYERLKIAERNTRGRRLKVKAGSVMTHGQSPYGYRLIEENNKWMLKIHEKEAEVVRWIFKWYTEGDVEHEPLGIVGIVRKLTEMRVPTYMDNREAEAEENGDPRKFGRKKRKWGEWSRGSVHHILTNETYSGIWHYGKRGTDINGRRTLNSKNTTLAVEVPSIISRDIWEATQSRLIYNRENAKRNLKHKYLLGRRLYCGDCGCKMGSTPNHSHGHTYLYYRCNAKRCYAVDCTNTVSYSARSLDAQVWQWIKGLLSDPKHLQDSINEIISKQEENNAPIIDQLKITEELIGENQEQLDRLLDLYLSGDFSKDVLLDRKNRLEMTIEGLENKYKELQNHLEANILTPKQTQTIHEFAERVRAGLEKAEDNFETRRKVIDLLNTHGVLIREGKLKVAHVQCILGENIMQIASKGSGSAGDTRSNHSLMPVTVFSSQTSAAITAAINPRMSPRTKSTNWRRTSLA